MLASTFCSFGIGSALPFVTDLYASVVFTCLSSLPFFFDVKFQPSEQFPLKRTVRLSKFLISTNICSVSLPPSRIFNTVFFHGPFEVVPGGIRETRISEHAIQQAGWHSNCAAVFPYSLTGLLNFMVSNTDNEKDCK
ncbi:hypothetical protein CEXT_512591 [Caerostris extrusa]|uniref:Uncharacterized protein n=1 Tax=Caerostris extrusa TaxID=172846 RepID=A0AAV4XI16_CAEEX|nr:hypothetical protein CEXT_512591 [Caerostris extrusa]